MTNRWGNSGNSDSFSCHSLHFHAPKSLQMVTVAIKLKDTCSLEGSYDQPRQDILKQRHYFANKVHLVKAMVFPVVMYGCESWTIKKTECQKIDAFLKRTLETLFN